VIAMAIQPTLGGGFDGFVAKLNITGSTWKYLTYLGGTRDDYATGIAVDSSGSARVAGYTISADFPQASALQPALAGNPTLFSRPLLPARRGTHPTRACPIKSSVSPSTRLPTPI